MKRFEAEDLMMGINASNPSHSRLFLNEHQQHGIGGEGGQEERWEDQEGEEGEERSVWREEKTDFNISDGDWEAFKAGVKKVRRYLERKEGEKVGEWVNEVSDSLRSQRFLSPHQHPSIPSRFPHYGTETD